MQGKTTSHARARSWRVLTMQVKITSHAGVRSWGGLMTICTKSDCTQIPIPHTRTINEKAIFSKYYCQVSRNRWIENTSSFKLETDDRKLWAWTNLLNEEDKSRGPTKFYGNGTLFTTKQATTNFASNYEEVKNTPNQ